MGEPATPPRRMRARRADKLGDNALHFFRWFRRSKFHLMGDFVSELDCSPDERDAALLARRFEAALRHARRVLALRLVVTLLLAAGLIATVAASVAPLAPVPEAMASDVATWLALLDRVAAVAGTLTVALVALRLGFDRYLELVDTSATFLAMQLVTARCAARA